MPAIEIKSKTSALLMLALVAAMWSTSGVLIKAVTWSPLALASSRGLLAAMALAFLVPGGFRPKALTKIHWITGICSSLLSCLFITSMKLTTAANVIVLQYTAPIWVAVLAPILLRERTGWLDWFFMSLMFAGIVLFFFDGLSADDILGNILAILGGVTYGFQAILLKKIKDGSHANAMILGCLITFVVGLPAWGAPWPALSGWMGLFALGIFQFGLPYYLLTLTIPKVRALDLVLVTTLEPILCTIWVYLLIGEKPGQWAFLGGVIVIASVTVWSVLKARKDPQPPIINKTNQL